MTRVSGFLQTVIKEPSKVIGVWVRADRLRTSATGLTTPEQESVEWNPDTGEVSFDAEPGKATLVLQYLSRTESVPIGIPDEPTATLRQVVGYDYDYPAPVLSEVERYRNQTQADAERAEAAAEELRLLAAGFDISFAEDPPGSGLFIIPTVGFAPDPVNDGLYLIGK